MELMNFGSALAHPDKTNSNLQKLLNRLLESSQPLIDCQIGVIDTPYWDASFWHYQQLSRWNAIEPASQYCILQTAAHDKLCELYLYAQGAMAACGRLFWLSEDPLQRQIYALIMADYSTHQTNLKSLLPLEVMEASDFTLAHYLSRNIEVGSYASLVVMFLLVFPTLLYQRVQLLAQACQHVAVSQILDKFAKDLLRHRYCGRVLHRQAPIKHRNIHFLQQELLELGNILQAIPFYSLTPCATILGNLQAQDIADYSPYFYEHLPEHLHLVHAILEENQLLSLCEYLDLNTSRSPRVAIADPIISDADHAIYEPIDVSENVLVAAV